MGQLETGHTAPSEYAVIELLVVFVSLPDFFLVEDRDDAGTAVLSLLV